MRRCVVLALHVSPPSSIPSQPSSESVDSRSVGVSLTREPTLRQRSFQCVTEPRGKVKNGQERCLERLNCNCTSPLSIDALYTTISTSAHLHAYNRRGPPFKAIRPGASTSASAVSPPHFPLRTRNARPIRTLDLRRRGRRGGGRGRPWPRALTKYGVRRALPAGAR